MARRGARRGDAARISKPMSSCPSSVRQSGPTKLDWSCQCHRAGLVETQHQGNGCSEQHKTTITFRLGNQADQPTLIRHHHAQARRPFPKHHLVHRMPTTQAQGVTDIQVSAQSSVWPDTVPPMNCSHHGFPASSQRFPGAGPETPKLGRYTNWNLSALHVCAHPLHRPGPPKNQRQA